MKIFICLSMCCFFITASNAQPSNYITYYQSIIKAEELALQENKYCFVAYDKIFADKKYQPFLFEIYNAAQFAWALRDTVHFLKYMKLLANNHMPNTCFFKSPAFRTIPTSNPDLIRQIDIYFAKAPKKKQSSRHQELKDWAWLQDSLHDDSGRDAEDPKAIRFDVYEEKYRQYILQHFLSKGIFPSEKIVGLQMEGEPHFEGAFEKKMKAGNVQLVGGVGADGKMTMDFVADSIAPLPKARNYFPKSIFDIDTSLQYDEWSLITFNCYAPYVHHTYSFKQYQKELWQCVLGGTLHPKDYAMIEEANVYACFSADDRFNRACKYEKEKIYYYALGDRQYSDSINTLMKTEPGAKILEQNRAEKFIRKYKTEEAMKKFEIRYNVSLFHGFLYNR
jgi:hypothetical protein